MFYRGAFHYGEFRCWCYFQQGKNVSRLWNIYLKTLFSNVIQTQYISTGMSPFGKFNVITAGLLYSYRHQIPQGMQTIYHITVLPSKAVELHTRATHFAKISNSVEKNVTFEERSSDAHKNILYWVTEILVRASRPEQNSPLSLHELFETNSAPNHCRT